MTIMQGSGQNDESPEQSNVYETCQAFAEVRLFQKDLKFHDFIKQMLKPFSAQIIARNFSDFKPNCKVLIRSKFLGQVKNRLGYLTRPMKLDPNTSLETNSVEAHLKLCWCSSQTIFLHELYCPRTRHRSLGQKELKLISHTHTKTKTLIHSQTNTCTLYNMLISTVTFATISESL